MFAIRPDLKKPVPREITLAVMAATGTDKVSFYNSEADLFAFGCDEVCPEHQGGPHLPQPQCGALVCVLCAKVFP